MMISYSKLWRLLDRRNLSPKSLIDLASISYLSHPTFPTIRAAFTFKDMFAFFAVHYDHPTPQPFRIPSRYAYKISFFLR